jgi:steroid delta-isomerase-like uncharacterized protein
VDTERRSTLTRDADTLAHDPGLAAENARIARRLYEELWNNRDYDGMVKYAADNIECLNVATNTAARGKEGYKLFAQGWASAFSDARVEIKRVVGSASGATIEFLGRGTHTGALAGPTGTIHATGRKVVLPVCDVLEIEDGMVRRFRSYYDGATLMRQLGVAG